MLQNFINKVVEIFTSKEGPFSLVSKTVRHLVLAQLELIENPDFLKLVIGEKKIKHNTFIVDPQQIYLFSI
jgi:hypothetical protein